MNTVNETSTIPFLEYCKARKHFYQFLQVLFFKPLTAPVLLQIKNEGHLQNLADMGEGGQILQHFFDQTTETNLPTVRDEFNELFVGPGTILAPPWESVYTSREQLLFDKSTLEVRELYHELGLQYIQEQNEPDDHLVVEIEFLLHLNELTSNINDQEKLNELIAKQIHFLENHLVKWVPLFTKRILDSAKSDLYKGAATLLQDFILFDLDSLKEFEEVFTNGE